MLHETVNSSSDGHESQRTCNVTAFHLERLFGRQAFLDLQLDELRFQSRSMPHDSHLGRPFVACLDLGIFAEQKIVQQYKQNIEQKNTSYELETRYYDSLESAKDGIRQYLSQR